jgi:hypothetical protein
MIMKKNLLNSFTLIIGVIFVVSIVLLVSRVIAKPLPTQAAQAFTTGVLSYQGTLVDSLGNPVTGSDNLTFSLYSSLSSTTPLWQEVRSGVNAVPIADGLFSIMLGSLQPIPVSVWDESELYLGVKVGADSEMSPRERLAIVPSAAIAEVAQLALTVPDGSIGEAQLASEAISSKNTGLTHGEIYGSGEALTLTASPQNIPSLSFTVNPTTPQVLQVSVSLDAWFFPNCGTLLARVEIDNVPVGPVMTLASYSNVIVRSSISTTRQVNITPGAHTVDFKAFCETAGTGTLGQILTGQSSVSYILFSQ